MSTPLDPKHRAADNIVDSLEAQIASGELADNSPLPAERELMAQFGASRTVVREAITALANRGLILSKPRFRPVVRTPDYKSALDAVGGIARHLVKAQGGVRNLYDSRVFLERALVREAATSANKEDIQNLKDALAHNHASISDSVAFHKSDTAFHAVLYRIPRNPIFPAIHEGYVSWLAPHWDQMERSPERNLSNYHAHKTIFDAILDRDPMAAEEALALHLKTSWEHVRRTIEDDVS